ncbi:MAG TPA: YfhO family protein [Vicinamibacterales bacterium]|nr:YfhO family protein [Vicinamibacterales bacterium]
MGVSDIEAVRHRWELPGVALAYGLTTLAALYEFLFFGLTSKYNVSEDFYLRTFPAVIHHLQNAAREGIALWDTANFGGMPAIGSGAANPFDPLSYVAIAAGPTAAFGVSPLLHSIVAGVGMYALLRRVLGYSIVASFFGGVVFQWLPLSALKFDVFEAHLRVPMAYLPFVVAGTTMYLRTREARYMAGASLALVASIVFGTPMFLPLTALVLLLCTVVGGERGRRDGPIRSRMLAVGACACVGLWAAGLTAFILLPFVQTFIESTRWAFPSGTEAALATEIWTSVRSITAAGRPNLAGMSLLPLLVVLCAARAVWPRGLAGVANIAYPLVGFVGVVTLFQAVPRLAPLMAAVPVLGAVHPSFYLFFLDFALAVLVGAGAERWLVVGARGWAPRGLLALGTASLAWLVVFVVLLSVLAVTRTPHALMKPFTMDFVGANTPGWAPVLQLEFSTLDRVLRPVFQLQRWGVSYPPYFFGLRLWVVLSASFIQVVSLVWLVRRTWRTRERVHAMSPVVLVAVLGVAGASFGWFQAGETRSLAAAFYAETGLAEVVRELDATERVVYLVDDQNYYANQHQFFEAGPLVSGARLPNGFAHMPPARTARLLYASEFGPDFASPGAPARSVETGLAPARYAMSHQLDNELTRVFVTQLDSRYLDLFGASYVIAPNPIEHPRFVALFDEDVYTNHGDPVRVYLYKSQSPVPRAFVAERCLEMPLSDVIAAIENLPREDLTRVALAEASDSRESPCAPLGDVDTSGPSDAHIDTYSASRVTISLDGRRPGVLVLTDTYSPDWRAFVDGHSRPAFPVYGAFRGVIVEEGDETVQFVYRPRAVYAGMTVAGGTLALAIALLGRRRFSRVGSGQPES